MNNNQEEYLKDRLDEATERLRKAVRSTRDRDRPTWIVNPKGKTMYSIRRSISER